MATTAAGNRKRAQVRLRLAVQADVGEGDDLESQVFFVEQREVAGYDACLLKCPHAAQARRRGHPNLTGQLDIGDAAVGLQFLQDAPIGSIEPGTHGVISSQRPPA